MPAVSSAAPRKSTFTRLRGRSVPARATPRTAPASSPKGTFTKNTQCQDSRSVRKPPMSGPDDRREPPRRREVALHAGALLEAVEVRDDRHAQRDERAAAEPLERPARDQHRHRRREAREHRADQEDRQPREVHAPAPVEVREPPPERHRDGGGEDVAREDPGVDGEAAQARDHGRHRRRDGGRFHRAEEEPQHHPRDDETSARRRGAHAPVPRPAVVHWAHGHRPRSAPYGSMDSCPSCHVTRSAPSSRRISVGQAAGTGGHAPHGHASAQELERIDAAVPVLPRHPERVAADEGDRARAVRVGADQRQERARHGGPPLRRPARPAPASGTWRCAACAARR